MAVITHSIQVSSNRYCTSHFIFTTLKSHKVVRTGHWRTMPSLAMPFSKIVCMPTNHLATKQLLFEIVELGIRMCVWRQGESLASIVDSVFEESLVSDSSVNTEYIYWGSLWGQTCSSVIDCKLQLKHAPASLKSDKLSKAINNIKGVTRCRDSRSAKSRETR